MIRSLKYTIILLFFASQALAANVFINPGATYNGDGTTGADAAGEGQPGAYNTWDVVTFSSSNDYYQKCGSNEPGTITLTASGTSSNYITIGSYYGSGTIGLSGNRPTMTNPLTTGNTVRIEYDFIHLINFDFRRGEATIAIVGGDYNIIENCAVGGGASLRAVRIVSGNYNKIIDSTIDVMFSTYGEDGSDGLDFRSGTGNEAYGNTIGSWEHAQVKFDYATYTDVHDNTFNNPDNLGGSPFQSNFSGAYNKFRRNIVNNMGDYALLGGGTNYEVSYNVFNGGCLSGTGACDLTSTASIFQIYALSASASNNKIYNNYLYSPVRGMHVYSDGTSYANAGNEIINNVIHLYGGSQDQAVRITPNGDGNFGQSTYKNNVCYWDSGTVQVYNRTSSITVSAWNSAEDDTTEDNLAADPAATDPGTDFTISTGSPCEDYGLSLGDPYDTSLNDLDQDEHGDWEVGPYVIETSPADPGWQPTHINTIGGNYAPVTISGDKLPVTLGEME